MNTEGQLVDVPCWSLASTEVNDGARTKAMQFAERGWFVFPCIHGTKRPATRHGFQEASRDPSVIEDWFSEAKANVAISTGPSRLLVVDVDGAEGAQSLLGLSESLGLTETYTVRTRSGGAHYYFSVPAGVTLRSSAGRLGKGLDIRADGGYVLAPPSWVAGDAKGDGGFYTVEKDLPVAPVPDGLLEALRPSKVEFEPASGAVVSFPHTVTNVSRVREALARRVAEGGWEVEERWFHTLLEVRSLRDAGWSDAQAYELFDEFSKQVGGNYDPLKNRSRWDRPEAVGVLRRTFASLLHNEKRPDMTRGLMSAKQLADKVFPPLQWVIDGLLPEGSYILSARPKVGKSWMALHMALCVASGLPFWGKSVKQGPALYLALEDNQRRLRRRLTLLDPSGAWKDSQLDVSTEWPRAPDGGVEMLRNYVSTKRPRLVVIDTLAKFRAPTGRGENAYQSDYRALEPITQLAGEYGCAVIVVTHNRKGKSEDDPIEMISGTLGLAGSVDGFFVIEGGRASNTFTLTMAGRDIEEEATHTLQRDRHLWAYVGSGQQVGASMEQQEIIDVLRRHGPMKATEVAGLLGKKVGTVKSSLSRMHASRRVSWRDGRYGLDIEAIVGETT